MRLLTFWLPLFFGQVDELNQVLQGEPSISEDTQLMEIALFVAVAGLASASLAPANSQIRATQNSVTAGDPGPLIILPAPLPCQSVGACYAPASSTR